jgi:predicted alpha/beta-fold hydrolase
MNYAAPWWLPGGNLQTIWAALRSRRFLGPQPVFRRERWTTPDEDFVDVDWLVADAAVPATKPLLVVFHGLEGSSASHYAEALADAARERGWVCAIPHFRGCSGELNLAPRAYHSGDFAEIDWILRRFAAQHTGPVVAVGISLGGNALMRWAGEMGAEARQVVAGIASVCSPLDLAASGWAIGRGFNRQVYTRMFLRSMVPKALLKLEQHPGLFDRERLLAARDLYAFDNVFTAPVHGFKDADDYWSRASR